MGGGGGGGYFKIDRDDLQRRVEAAQRDALDKEYETECNDFLAELLTFFNDRDRDAIDRHLTEITRALEKEIDGFVELKFGGSVAKHTYVDGLSDVDALVMLDNCDLAESAPHEARAYLAKRLQERFPRTVVVQGTLAVTIRFTDVEIQLLPAVRSGDRVQIANASGQAWAAIRPREFSRVLTETNRDLGNKVVPTVKLAKGVIVNLTDRHKITGYHAESLAVEVFREYKGPLKLRDMLMHYFSEGANRILHPIRDRTGQSVHVDDQLGSSLSLERRIISDGFARIGRKMKLADVAASVDEWASLFGMER